jgi:hypothetical protein
MYSNSSTKCDVFHFVASLIVDFQDGTSMLQVITFAYSEYTSLLISLYYSMGNPVATRIAIQNLTFLMRINKIGRRLYPTDDNFKWWATNPRNPLYSLETVEGLLIASDDDPAGDLFAPEVQQFVYYIGQDKWPLRESLEPRVKDRFHSIWDRKLEDGQPAYPFGESIARWFSDHESEHTDDEDADDAGELSGEGFTDLGEGDDIEPNDALLEMADNYVRFINDDMGGDTELLDDEPENLTAGDRMAYFSAAEEAGLASRERRMNARNRAQQERDS